MALDNLPLPLSSFVGRERESAEVDRLLASSRLLTLTGPGGCGKTRLCVHVARRVADRFAGGVCFVPLATLADPALLPQSVASALHVAGQPGQALVDTVVEHLCGQPALLVLDNCEHLIEACATFVVRLLLVCPNLHILVTSREPLKVDGEFVWTVPPLSVPLGAASPSELLQYDAVRLFAERAAAVSGIYELTSQNVASVAQICRRLDGIPLAIELAAARVKLLSAEQIAARLDDALHLLTNGQRSAPQRQQTMRATLDWSHALLTSDERILFRRLSVFAGGWTLEAAEEVALLAVQTAGAMDDGEPVTLGLLRRDILDLLSKLVDKSLVVVRTGGDQSAAHASDACYDLLEPTRQYAAQKLADSGEAAFISERHMAYYLMLAETAGAASGGPLQGEAYERIEQTHDNLRAALRWALDHHKVENALRLAEALVPFWETRGYLHEGLQWLRQVLEVGEAHLQDNEAPAIRALRARLQVQAGRLYWHLGNYAAGRDQAEAALRHFRTTQDRLWVAHSLYALGRLIYQQGDDEETRRLMTESLAMYRELGDKPGMVESLRQLGILSLSEADYASARPRFEEAIALARQTGDLGLLSWPLIWLGRLSIEQGDVFAARAMLQEDLDFKQKMGYKVGMPESLVSVASLACATSQAQRAAKLCGAVERLTAGMVARLRRRTGQLHRRNVAAARALLAEADFDAAWSEGQALSLEQALAEAEQVLDAAQKKTAPPATRDPNELSLRELEVLRLLAAGLSYEQVAQRLVISPRTVNTHVTSIYSKLGVNSRGAATRYALDHQLL